MFACILAFWGIYVAVLGLACFVMQMQWQVTVFNMSVPISALCLMVGFLLALCVLVYMRVIGKLAGSEEKRVIKSTVGSTAKLGFFAIVASMVLQAYLRIACLADGLFLNSSEAIKLALQGTEPTIEGRLVFFALLLPLLSGLPLFIILFYKQSFKEYVTVTYKNVDGVKVELNRSDSYLPIFPTLLIGLLISFVLLFVAATPLIYLMIVPFAIYLYGKRDKKRMKSVGIISGIIALAAIILVFVI